MGTFHELRKGIRFRRLTACPCCGGVHLGNVIDDGADFETDLGRFAIRECALCGIQFTDPQPLKDDVQLLYTDRNSHDFDRSSWLVNGLRRQNNIRQLRRLPTWLRKHGQASLDYGCGSGFFTRSMRAYLPGRIIASDFHPLPPPLISTACDIEYMLDEDLDSLQGELDLIVCRNVLEHTVDPIEFLSRLRRLLKPAGILMLEVPNRQSTWTYLLGRYNFNYYLPRHLYHYDECSLERQMTGFTVVGRWFDHSPILGKSFASLLGKTVSGYSLAGIILFPLQLLLDAFPRRSSQLVVIVRRN